MENRISGAAITETRGALCVNPGLSAVLRSGRWIPRIPSDVCLVGPETRGADPGIRSRGPQQSFDPRGGALIPNFAQNRAFPLPETA